MPSTSFDIREGDVIMARRGFVRRSCLRDALQRKTHVALRSRLANLQLHQRRGWTLELPAKLQTLAIGRPPVGRRLYAVSCGTQRSHFAMAGANGRAGRRLSLDMRK